MKDQSELFKYIPDDVYARVDRDLRELKKRHPTYTDAQLLRALLCSLTMQMDVISGVGRVDPQRGEANA